MARRTEGVNEMLWGLERWKNYWVGIHQAVEIARELLVDTDETKNTVRKLPSWLISDSIPGGGVSPRVI